MNKTEINIMFSTSNLENTLNILCSIQKIKTLKKDKDFSLAITVFDKTHEQNILNHAKRYNLNISVVNASSISELENKYADFFYTANCSLKVDSIQRARIQQQVFIIDNYKVLKNSIIWQVDDDILFGRSNYINSKHIVSYLLNYFSEIVQFYDNNRSIDAIIAPTSYVPPIPSLLYSKTQLEDYLNREYIRKEPVDSLEYHDYYNQPNDEKSYSLFLSETKDKIEIIRSILMGKPITKVTCSEEGINEPKAQRSKLLRGGNFIVFNIDIFKIPHLGFCESDSIPARRSDMIHSQLLIELGFNIVDVNYFSLVHNRRFTNTTIEISAKKYFSDMIGALLIQYLYKGENEFNNRLKFHQNHIKKIVKLLCDNVDESIFRNEIDRLKELDIQINSFDKEHFINAFEDFRLNKNQLILKLCKLAS
ncbi:hypothetical protein [Bizionia sp. M204]|uniref:hypothetical protein n=1 Tax=Bizionia sp. M204 TaxID=2675331 RepID=UPI002064DBF1|nr:hypothetical protein [Bizionia sp. M204]UPS91392.1 hypothetical protein GMA17_06490 [Bizionia sp. M204]